MTAQVLPMYFDKIARFAALEVLLRGPGVRGEYDYTMQDALTVAIVYDDNIKDPVWPTDAHFRNVSRRKKQVLNLHNSFKRYMQQLGTKSPTHGQTNKDAQ